MKPNLNGILALAALIALGVPESALAARRTVQFAGIGAAEPRNAEMFNESSVATCVILVANTGRSTQVIDELRLLSFEQRSIGQIAVGNGQVTTGLSATNAEIGQTYFPPFGGSPAAGTTCINTQIQPNGVCVFRFRQVAIPSAGLYPLCAGTLVISDAIVGGNPVAPGSVAAAGSIYVAQETRVVGGVLSGATYLSPPDNAGLATADVAGGPGSPASQLPPNATVGDFTQNMNEFCAVACQQRLPTNPAVTIATNVRNSCREMCGQSVFSFGTSATNSPANSITGRASVTGTAPSYGISGTNTRMVPDSVFGWLDGAGSIEYLDGTHANTGNNFFNLAPLNGMASGGYDDADTSELSHGGVGVPTTIRMRGKVVSSATTGMTGSEIALTGTAVLRARIKLAGSHWAGGAVFESAMGALTSICSGNRTYWDEGGIEFPHPGSITDEGTFPVSGSMPPERLLCAHRHGQADLFMSTGSTVSFPINGGMPF